MTLRLTLWLQISMGWHAWPSAPYHSPLNTTGYFVNIWFFSTESCLAAGELMSQTQHSSKDSWCVARWIHQLTCPLGLVDNSEECPVSGVLLLDSAPSFIVFLPFPVSADASWDPFTDTLLHWNPCIKIQSGEPRLGSPDWILRQLVLEVVLESRPYYGF